MAAEETGADDIKMEDAPVAATEADSPADAKAGEEDDSQSPPDSKETGTPENVRTSLHSLLVIRACLCA